MGGGKPSASDKYSNLLAKADDETALVAVDGPQEPSKRRRICDGRVCLFDRKQGFAKGDSRVVFYTVGHDCVPENRAAVLRYAIFTAPRSTTPFSATSTPRGEMIATGRPPSQGNRSASCLRRIL